jgi:uncharacterized protein YjbJ (UPF0337 family)
MDENRIEGAVENGAGRFQDRIGDVLGDAQMRAKGKAREAMGAAQDLYGRASDRARDLSGQTGAWVAGNPWQAIGGAAIIGVVIGLLLGARRLREEVVFVRE